MSGSGDIPLGGGVFFLGEAEGFWSPGALEPWSPGAVEPCKSSRHLVNTAGPAWGPLCTTVAPCAVDAHAQEQLACAMAPASLSALGARQPGPMRR